MQIFQKDFSSTGFYCYYNMESLSGEHYNNIGCNYGGYVKIVVCIYNYNNHNGELNKIDVNKICSKMYTPHNNMVRQV